MNKFLLAALLLFSSNLFAQTWEQLGDATVGRHHPISFSIDGKGYAVTGTSAGGQPTDDTYEYDPILDTWTKLVDFPGADRSFGIGAVSNDIAYIGFGATNTQYLNDLWSFDPSTGVWDQLANCSCSGRRHPAMIATDTKIYVGLGDGALGNLDSWAVYDIAADSWTNIADLPGPGRHHPFMFNAGGEIFAGLGHNGPNIYNDWYKLNLTTETWTAMDDFPGESRVAGTQFNIGSYGYVLSGDGDNHSFMSTGEMWRYDPSDDSWLEFPPHPGISIWAPGSFVIDNDIYFFGGLNRDTDVFPTTVYKYADTTTVVIVDPNTSINDQENPDFSNTYTYPNPVENLLSLEMDEGITQIKIFNTTGQLILTSDANIKQINTENFNNGLYLIQFYDEDKLRKTSKFLINH